MQQPYFFIRYDSKYIKIDFNDIMYVEALRNYVKLHMTSRSYLVLIGLTSIEKELPQQLFCRVHRSYIVGMAHITSFDDETVYIRKETLPIGRVFKNSIIERVKILASPTRIKDSTEAL